MDGQTDGWTDKWRNIQMDKKDSWWTDGGTDRWMDRQMNGGTDK